MKASLHLLAAFVATTLAVLGSAKVLPIDQDPDNPSPIKIWPPADEEESAHKVPTGKPSAWCSICRNYVLVGADSYSNPYHGDTSTTQANSLLCIAGQGIPKPHGLPDPVVTPGGALKNSWSGAQLFTVPNVLGTDLTSLGHADHICATYGAQKYPSIVGARMAEFHDGDNDAGWAGWGFWGEQAYLSDTFGGRLWIRINDQSTNPWDNGGGARMVLTFMKKAMIMLCT